MTSPGGNVVEIRVVSKDQTGPGFASATAHAKQLATSVGGQGPGSVASAYDQADKKATGLGGSLRRVGEVAAGVLTANVLVAGAQRLKGFFSQTIESASALGESVNAVTKVFGESSAKVMQWGQANANSIGLSTRAFNQMATPLGSMLKNQGLSMAQVSEQTIKLTQRAADMASVFNTDVTDALTAVQAGLRGEQDPLERYGVSLSAVSVEARALADSHKTSAAQLTTQEKAVARLNLIYDQTASTAGDFRDTATGLANAQRVANATMEEARAKIGQGLLPIMAKAAEVSGMLAGTFVRLPQPITLTVVAIAALAAGLLLLAPRILATRTALLEMAASNSLAQRGIAGLAGEAAKATVVLAGLAIAADKAGLFDNKKIIHGSFLDSLATGLKGITATNAPDRLKEIDKALADMASGGHASDAMDKLRVAAAKAGMSLEDAKAVLPEYAAATDAAGGSTDAMGEAAKRATVNLGDLINKYDKLIGDSMSLEEAEDHVANSLANLTEQIKKQKEEGVEGAGSLTGMTQAARDNRESVRDLVRQYEDLIVKYQVAGKNTIGLEQKLEDQLVTAGFAREEAHKYTQQLKDLATALQSIPAVTTADVIVRYQTQETDRETRRLLNMRASGGIVGAAGGGPRSGQTLVGEHGPEIVDLAPGTTVHSNEDSMRMAGSGSQRLELMVSLDPSIGGQTRDLVETLCKLLRYQVRVNGSEIIGIPSTT